MDGSMHGTAPTAEYLPASARLEALAQRLEPGDGARVGVGEVVESLGDAGLGLTLVLLMLPVFSSIPGLPLGFMFGFLVVLLGVQVLRGAHSLHLPAGIRTHGLRAGHVRRVLQVAVPWLRWAERWLRTGRLVWFTAPPVRRVLGVVLVVLGLALAVPLPFGDQPPALAVVAIGLGLMERDGAAIALGLVLSLFGVAWNLLLIVTSAELVIWAIQRLGW